MPSFDFSYIMTIIIAGAVAYIGWSFKGLVGRFEESIEKLVDSVQRHEGRISKIEGILEEHLKS